MQSFKSRVLYHVVKYQLARLGRRNLSLEAFRTERERTAQRLFKMPPAVRTEAAHLAGCHAEWLRPDTPRGPGLVLYVHGGAYTSGSCITHRTLAARLAATSGHATLTFNYRLAPEHAFPAALDDAFAMYLALRAAAPEAPIALAGDSAGAGLSVALALRLQAQGAPLPVGLALMSPWTDLALTHPTHQTHAAVDPYFPTTDRLAASARHYAGEHPLDHPLLSPHYAQLKGLPPMLIHVGQHETLLQDSLALAERSRAHGGVADIKVWPGMWHVWQAFGGMMREADASIAELGLFLRQRLQA